MLTMGGLESGVRPRTPLLPEQRAMAGLKRLPFLQAEAASLEAELGNTVQVRQGAVEALTLLSGRDVRILAAEALARAGNSGDAQKQLDALNKEFPLDTLVQNYWLPTCRAEIELNRGHAQRAHWRL